VTFCVLHAFFVIDYARLRIVHVNVTAHPTAEWIIQQLREAFPLGKSSITDPRSGCHYGSVVPQKLRSWRA